MQGKKIWFFRFLFLGMFVVVASILFASYRHHTRSASIENEIAALRAEADEIARENTTLREKITYFSTESFQEREAKDKLGLQRPNEKVVVIKPSSRTEYETSRSEENLLSEDRTATFREPNYKKWWDRLWGRDDKE